MLDKQALCCIVAPLSCYYLLLKFEKYFSFPIQEHVGGGCLEKKLFMCTKCSFFICTGVLPAGIFV